MDNGQAGPGNSVDQEPFSRGSLDAGVCFGEVNLDIHNLQCATSPQGQFANRHVAFHIAPGLNFEMHP